MSAFAFEVASGCRPLGDLLGHCHHCPRFKHYSRASTVRRAVFSAEDRFWDDDVYANERPEVRQRMAKLFSQDREPPVLRASQSKIQQPDHDNDGSISEAVSSVVTDMQKLQNKKDPDEWEQQETLEAIAAEEQRRDDPVLSTLPPSFFSTRDREFRQSWLEERKPAEKMKEVLDMIDAIVAENPTNEDPFAEVEVEEEEALPVSACSVCAKVRSGLEIRDNGGICESCYTERQLETSQMMLRRGVTSPPTTGQLGTQAHVHGQEKALRDMDDEKLNEAMTELFKTNKPKRRPRSVATVPMGSEYGGAEQPTVTDEIDGESARVDSTGKSPQAGDNSNGSDNHKNEEDKWSRVKASQRSLRTINPIRDFIQNMKAPEGKAEIRLDIGDPTVRSSLEVPEAVKVRLSEIVTAGKSNGYPLSMGDPEARKAVASLLAKPGVPTLAPTDVMIFGGASGALEAVIGAIANDGDNVLIPCPGFPLFRTIAEGYNVECRTYKLLSDDGWKVDLDSLQQAHNERTVAIIVNNPSNPCGSVYSRDHLQDIALVAESMGLPIIADEIYADMVFKGVEFTPMAAVSSKVPLISVGGISKKFIVPGWRLGWIALYDSLGVLESGGIREGLQRLSTRMLVANSLVQKLLPWMIAQHQDGESEVGLSFRCVMEELEKNSNFVMKRLRHAEGLHCIEPHGAMYLMVKVDCAALGVEDDMDFALRLLAVKSVWVLPGSCFQAPNYIRIVFSGASEQLREGCTRIQSFCSERREIVKRASSPAQRPEL